MTVLATSLFALGHAFLWIGLVNRLHALGIRRRTIKWLTLLFFACAAILPLVVLGWWIGTGGAAGGLGAATGCYAALCAVIAPVTLLRLVVLRTLQRRPRIVRLYWRHPVELDLPLARPSWPWSPAGRQAAMEDGQAGRHWLARLPLNEILRLDVTRWTIDVPRLDPDLDGLSIAHLSDFHFTGHVGKGYFRAVVRAANELRPDLVALTGDYVDHRQCLDWVTETVGELAARYGVFFVLGNHDVPRSLRRRSPTVGPKWFRGPRRPGAPTRRPRRWGPVGGQRVALVRPAGPRFWPAARQTGMSGPPIPVADCPGPQPRSVGMGPTLERRPIARRAHARRPDLHSPAGADLLAVSAGREALLGHLSPAANRSSRHPRRLGRHPGPLELQAGDRLVDAAGGGGGFRNSPQRRRDNLFLCVSASRR